MGSKGKIAQLRKLSSTKEPEHSGRISKAESAYFHVSAVRHSSARDASVGPTPLFQRLLGLRFRESYYFIDKKYIKDTSEVIRVMATIFFA